MERVQYIAARRARFSAIGGPVNIPYGTSVEAVDGFLERDGLRLCAVTSESAHKYFAKDSDGNGLERGALVAAIIARLEKKGDGHQDRWDKVWGDSLCQKYRRPEHEDFWLWNYDFFNAPVADLRYIAQLIGARVR